MKKSVRKFKFCVGGCGGRLIYTNIIKAEDAIEAARIYLESTQEPYTEDDVFKWAGYAKEIQPVERPDTFVDAYGDAIKVDDFVSFIRRESTYGLQIRSGHISRFTKAKVYIIDDIDGQESGLVSDQYAQVKRIIKLNSLHKAEDGASPVDALGQLIEMGDEVVYLDSFNSGSSTPTYFQEGGKVDEFKRNLIHADKMGGRKQAKSFVVIRKNEV